MFCIKLNQLADPFSSNTAKHRLIVLEEYTLQRCWQFQDGNSHKCQEEQGRSSCYFRLRLVSYVCGNLSHVSPTNDTTASHYPKEERKLLRKLDLAILIFGSLSCESDIMLPVVTRY